MTTIRFQLSHFLLVCALLAPLGGWTTNRLLDYSRAYAASQDEFVSIGGFEGTMHAIQAVDAAFSLEKIPCTMEGSVGYGLKVRRKDVDRAIEVWRLDAEKNGYVIWISQ